MTRLHPDRDDSPVAPGGGHMLGPATRMLWRAPGAVHFEMGGSATVVEGLPLPVVRNLATPPHTRLPHPDAPPGDAQVSHALAALARAGYLWTRPPADDPWADDERAAVTTPRLAGELTALAARHGEGAAQVLAGRRHAVVAVRGTSRTAAHLAALLAAAGVGRVACAPEGTVRLHHAVPGGATPADEGRPLAVVAHRAVRLAAPDVETAVPPPEQRADLTILAVDEAVPDERRRALHADDAPYLAVSLGIDHGVVGPLVLPGLTSCLRCADLHRRDRDPAWSALAVQLAIGRRHGPASDVALATVIAGTAALQALAFLDGGEPAVLDATVELALPDWRLRRRSWPPHPDCDCIAGA